MGVLAFAMLQSLVAPVLPDMQERFDTTQRAVTWVVTANLLSAAAFTPILGRVGDAAGKARTLVGVLVVLAAGCMLAMVAPNIGVTIVARVAQGAAGAVFPLAFGIIRDEYPAARVASGIGAMSAVVAAGGGLGIVLAGPILDNLGYRWLWAVPMLLGAVAAALVHCVVPPSPVRADQRIAWPAAVLLAAGLVTLLLAVSESPARGWASGTTLALLLGAAVFLAAWVARELRAPEPLVDIRMLRHPVVWTTNLTGLLFGAAWFAVFAFLPQFIQAPASAGYGFGASVGEAGLLLVPMVVTMFTAGLVSGPLEPHLDLRLQLVAGSAASAAANVALGLANDTRAEVAAAAALFGAGAGLVFAAGATLIVRGVSPDRTGVASGMNANFRTIGGSIGAAAMAGIVTAAPQAGGLPDPAGYRTGFLVLAGVSAAAGLSALRIPTSRPPPGRRRPLADHGCAAPPRVIERDSHLK